MEIKPASVFLPRCTSLPHSLHYQGIPYIIPKAAIQISLISKHSWHKKAFSSNVHTIKLHSYMTKRTGGRTAANMTKKTYYRRNKAGLKTWDGFITSQINPGSEKDTVVGCYCSASTNEINCIFILVKLLCYYSLFESKGNNFNFSASYTGGWASFYPALITSIWLMRAYFHCAQRHTCLYCCISSLG